jgi:murein DD-endopeptidase MepM/ murein hydrolase activator NlpD
VDVEDPQGRQAVLVIAVADARRRRLDLPRGARLSAPPTWLGTRLVLSLEDRAGRRSATLLADPEHDAVADGGTQGAWSRVARALGRTGVAEAASYAVVFGNLTSAAGTLTLGLPHAALYDVTSKFNQPRDLGGLSGTNPHQGTDLGAPYGTPVLAPWDGWVTSANASRYEMFLYLDLDGDGVRNDNAHLKFDHLSSISVASGRVSKGTRVAYSGNEGGAYAAHLHFGLRKDLNGDGTSDVWIRNEPYYRGIAGWDNGQRLDFLAFSTYSANVAGVTCYGKGGGAADAVAAGDVIVFHRRTGTSAWSASTAAKSGHRFTLSFTGRYPPGTSIQWMARCSRTSIKSSGTQPYWAYHPPKFYQPGLDPNATAELFDSFVNTVQ